MAAALVGCKIMKEMAHLATEAETARSMKNAKYEHFAMGETHTTTKQQAQQSGEHSHSNISSLLSTFFAKPLDRELANPILRYKEDIKARQQ